MTKQSIFEHKNFIPALGIICIFLFCTTSLVVYEHKNGTLGFLGELIEFFNQNLIAQTIAVLSGALLAIYFQTKSNQKEEIKKDEVYFKDLEEAINYNIASIFYLAEIIQLNIMFAYKNEKEIYLKLSQYLSDRNWLELDKMDLSLDMLFPIELLSNQDFFNKTPEIMSDKDIIKHFFRAQKYIKQLNFNCDERTEFCKEFRLDRRDFSETLRVQKYWRQTFVRFDEICQRTDGMIILSSNILDSLLLMYEKLYDAREKKRNKLNNKGIKTEKTPPLEFEGFLNVVQTMYDLNLIIHYEMGRKGNRNAYSNTFKKIMHFVRAAKKKE